MNRGRDIARLSRLLVFVQLLTYSGRSTAQEPQPADVVQKLYHEVTKRGPNGVPHGAAKQAIWPLLSKRLIAVFETRNACDQDWDRQHPNANVPGFQLKAPGWYESGLFSGPSEMAAIDGAVIERTQAQKNGAFLVYVRLAHSEKGNEPYSPAGTGHWQVGVRVISEARRFAVDDILFLNGYGGDEKGTSVWLSKMITVGCNGPHAVPDSDRNP